MLRSVFLSLFISLSVSANAGSVTDSIAGRDSVGDIYYSWKAVKASNMEGLDKDTVVAGLIAGYKVHVDRHVNQVIGRTETGWNKDGDENSSVSVFMTDAIRTYADRYLDAHSEISIMNLGGMRSTLEPGNIRLYNIYELSPFDNRIVSLGMKGSSIRLLVNDIVSRHSRFEGISGMELKISGNKVLSISVGGEDLDDERVYRLVTIDFLYNGGDGLDRLQEAVWVRKSDVILRNAIIQLIKDSEKRNEPVNAYPETRVIKEGIVNE